MKNLFCCLSLFLLTYTSVFANDFKVGDPVRVGAQEGVITQIKDGRVYLTMTKQVQPRDGSVRDIQAFNMRLNANKFNATAISLVPLEINDKSEFRPSDKLLIKDSRVNYYRGNALVNAIEFEGKVLELYANGYAKIEYSEIRELSNNGAFPNKLPNTQIKLIKLDDVAAKNITPLGSGELVDFFAAGDDVICTNSRGQEFGGKIIELYKSHEAKIKFTFTYAGEVERKINEVESIIELDSCNGATRDSRMAKASPDKEVEGSDDKEEVSSAKREAKKSPKIEYYYEDGKLKSKIISK
ncbi:MAG: hypothetical protein CME70_14245 [Halobacteriovorax sp.]|nr:hypothetical protein [Halobacteriovorax sp.]|tara:strand:+ start:290938 stop:291831 length:894 start_codon:yes stop_codon:yes gene_type:complete